MLLIDCNLVLQDRLILAAAKHLGTPVISSDQEFASVEDIEVIW
jgi:predicted nucleic acid-binding protein